MRKLFFKPHNEEAILEQIRVFLYSRFTQMQAKTVIGRPEKSLSFEQSLELMLSKKQVKISKFELFGVSSQVATYFSKVAEVNARGELDGEDSEDEQLVAEPLFKVKLPLDLQTTSYLHPGGRYFDAMMRDIPNSVMRQTFIKKQFAELKIVGQFNKGFVLALLN